MTNIDEQISYEDQAKIDNHGLIFAENISQELSKAAALDDLCYDDMWAAIVDNLSTEQFAQLFLKCFGRYANCDEPLNLDQKKFWLEVAEIIGPDHAQGMYHAAVFVTKNA